MTFGEKVLDFNSQLHFSGILPEGIRMMNPFKDNPETTFLAEKFYKKYFNDHFSRYIMLGINPGRSGAGITGIPFTDTVRLNEKCGIPFHSFRSYEPSSVFIYDMIDAFGGVEFFYRNFLISAICPLGFVKQSNSGRMVNYNYYDSTDLQAAVYDFIIENLHRQLDFGIKRQVCICLGTGKNEDFLRKINDRFGFFESVVALEHPRFIMQYRAKTKEQYIEKYVKTLKTIR